MNCSNSECSAVVPPHERYCVVCGSDAGFPNVRAAAVNAEVDALNRRVACAISHAKQAGTETDLGKFSDTVRRSKAVIALPLGKLFNLVSSDNALLSTFYQEVDGESRLPENNEWDVLRESVDALMFPSYFQKIRFGALSIDGLGVTKYGDLSIVLRDSAIRNRATVFECNSVEFVRTIGLTANEIPAGYRAVWDSREKLAVAKKAKEISPTTEDHEFSTILMNGDDYIEVHIYGPVHKMAIETLTGKRPKQQDKPIFESIVHKLKHDGVGVEIT